MSKNGREALPYSVSQKFLTEKRILDRLVRLAGIRKSDTVLEIGAGRGHITRALAEAAEQVVAYEIDGTLYEKLRGALPGNVRLLHGDFLACSLPRERYRVFANIPFSHTTDILKKLTRGDRLPESMHLVMEKGAAMRFLGRGGENLLSLLIKPFFDGRVVWRFRREDFHPAPRVDCVLCEFTKKRCPDIAPGEKAAFERFLRQGMAGRIPLTKRQISRALREAGLPEIGPPGEILYIQWLCLFRCSRKLGGKT